MTSALDIAAGLEAMIDSAAERGAHRALADHSPVVAVNVDAAARSLSTSAPTIRRLVAGGHLPVVPHVGNRVLIPLLALESFANSAPHLKAVADVS